MIKAAGPLFLCFSIYVISSQVAAQETMTMSFTNHYPHTFETNIPGKPAGAAVRYVEKVAEIMSVKVQWIGPLPYNRQYSMHKKGVIDGYSIEVKEEAYIADSYFTDKPFHSAESILVLKKTHPLNEVKNGNDIKGLTIGWVDDEYFSPFMEENKESVKFDYLVSENHWQLQLRKVCHGRIDAVYDLNQYTLPALAQAMGISDCIKVLKLPDKPIEIYVVFSKASPNGKTFAEKFNATQKTFEFYNEEYKQLIDSEVKKHPYKFK